MFFKKLLPVKSPNLPRMDLRLLSSLGIRDDVRCAMKIGEVTLTVVADFSKAFDTVCFKTTIDKFYKLGFSKMSNRLQFDEKASVFIITQFWILQGSILGLMIFNLYVVDLHEIIPK